ncbi:hypothetical protein, partial [Rhizobium brockwellii]|uniref:hypothetical protein n=1 Tax=Rhizobium brockwellii TaxID=3019932 RepID=UPI003F952CBE
SPSISCAVCCVSYSTELEDGANSDLKAAFLTNAISQANARHLRLTRLKTYGSIIKLCIEGCRARRGTPYKLSIWM